MVERKVGFNLDLSPGVSQLRNQMSSVIQLSRNTTLQIQHIEEQHQLRMKGLKQRQMDVDKNAVLSSVEAHRKAVRAIETEEERHSLRMRQITERGILAQQQKGSGLGGKFGASLISRGISSVAPNFIGSSISSGIDAGVGASLLGATAAAATGIGVLAGAAVLAGTALSAFTNVAQSVLGAVTQIGGARGLQEMLVEGAGTERMAANIAANITEKLTSHDIMSTMNTMSQNSEFTPAQVGALLDAYKGKTGNVSSLTNLGSFGTDLASVSGMGTQATGSLLGQLNAQFGLQGSDLKNAAVNLWQQGRAGTVELKNAESISQALAFSRAAGAGNLQKGMGLEMGAVQLAQKGIGGTSADEAVTSIRRLQEDLMNKPGQIQSVIGGGAIGGHDTQGNFVFNNLTNTLARLSLAELQNKIPKKLIDERAARAPRAIGEYAAQSPEFQAARTDAERVKVIETQIKALSSADMAIDDFDGALKKVQDTVDYQFKQSFNKVSVELEGVFLPVLREMIPVLKNFADEITTHKQEIGDMFRKFLQGLIMVSMALPDLASGIVGIAKWLLSFVPDAGDKITDDQKKIKEADERIAYQKEHPNPFSNSFINDAQNEKKDAEKDLKIWTDIKKIQDMDLSKFAKDAKDKADKMVPDVLQIPETKIIGDKKQDTANGHLEKIVTAQDKQVQILEDIRKNTKIAPHGPPAPDRSHNG